VGLVAVGEVAAAARADPQGHVTHRGASIRSDAPQAFAEPRQKLPPR
jgi:hypothetical protein